MATLAPQLTMSQATATLPLANIPVSSSARHQFQQYLTRLPTASSSSPSSSSPTDLNALLQRSTALASRVDALHAQVSSGNNTRTDDPQLFWTTLTLLTNLREASSQLQRASSSSSDRKAAEAALTRTQQNVEIVESILRMLSVSGGDESTDAFTAPVGLQAGVAVPSSAGPAAGRKGYEYWKHKTLAAIDADDLEDHSLTSADEDTASDTDSILTDPEIHLAKPSTTRLAGLKPSADDDDDDIAQYDRALKATNPTPPSTSTPTAPTSSSTSETILQSDRATHEALSSELLRMASILKSNSLAFADSLERDRLLLEKAGTDLGQNLDLMTRTRGRLGVYSKKARGMGWFTLSAIVVVIVSWMMMFLLIRLT